MRSKVVLSFGITEKFSICSLLDEEIAWINRIAVTGNRRFSGFFLYIIMERFPVQSTLKTCIPVPNATLDFLNIYLHVLILFGFLTLFYIFYISKIKTTAMTNEINSQLSNNLLTSLNNLSAIQRQDLKNKLKFVPFDLLIKNYSKQDTGYKIHNIWLFRVAYLINMMLILGFLIAIILLSLSCGNCLGVFQIIKHNAFVFTLVGIVEYLFFTNIASKFVPTEPSLMINVFISDIKNLYWNIVHVNEINLLLHIKQL